MSRLDGRKVLVSGGSSGIGRAIAKRAISEGASVAILGRGQAALDEVAKETGAIPIQGDIGDQTGVKTAVDTAAAELGGIDLLVNNAGAMIHSRLSLGRFDDWRQMVDTNVLGVMFITDAALSHIRKAGSGDIVNISSTSARRVALPDYTLYSATKSAVEFISRGLRAELAAEDIRVSIISPGLVRNTGFGRDIRDEALRNEIMASKDDRGIDPDLIAQQVVTVASLPREARIDELIIVPAWQVA